ncbi:MAG: glycosyltransferase [Nitrospirae bacterium]|nr:glycosyltransferase [Nitrospirota bacterium]
MRNLIDISIIIPTFNSARSVRDCLEAIRDNTYPEERVEIVIVDNGSKDETLSIAGEFTRHIHVDRKASVSRLRNIGVSRARGEIIGFVDSDCIISTGWIKRSVETGKENRVNFGLAGFPYSLPDNPGWIELAWNSTILGREGKRKFISAGNMVVRRDTFLKLGGFNESLITGEDYELCQRIREKGLAIIFDEGLKSKHLGNPKTLYQLFKKEVWYGKGMAGTMRHEFFSKPFFLAVIYLLLTFTILFGLYRYWARNETGILLASLACYVFIPVFIALHKASKPIRYRLLSQLIPIYFVYILGRMVSLFYLFKTTKRDTATG